MRPITMLTAGLTACTTLLCGTPVLPAMPEQTMLVCAADGTYEQLTYTSTGTEITITGCDASAVSLTIPSEIDGLPVTSIANSALRDRTALTSVSIPGSVVKIGDQAFSGCTALTVVRIVEGVSSIGTQSFYGCTALRSLTLPASITTVPGNAFQLCENLVSIAVEADNPAFTAVDGCLYTADGTTLVCCPGGYTGTLTIPDGVTTVGPYACDSCTKLTGIAFPDSITEIGNCGFERCSGLTDVTLPEGVTTLGRNAFFMCQSMTAITLPASITEIKDSAFLNCTALETVYYTGTQAQWDALAATVDQSSNTFLFRAELQLVDAQGSVPLGDLNADGAVDSTDASVLLIAAANTGSGAESGLTAAQETAADINGDGAFNATDAARILQYAAYVGSGGTLSIEEFLAS